MDGQQATVESLDLLLETMVTPEGIRPRSETLPLLCEKAVDVIGCAVAMLRLVDDTGLALHTVAFSDPTGALSPEHVAVARDEELSLANLDSHVVRRGSLPPSVEAFLSGEVQVVGRTSGRDVFPLASMCVLPLVRRGKSVGVLAFYWTEPHEPDELEHRIARITARLAALIVEAAGLHERLTDRLTHAESTAKLLESAVERAEETAVTMEEVLAATRRDDAADAVIAALTAHGIVADITTDRDAPRGDEDRAAGRTPIEGERCHGTIRHPSDSAWSDRMVRFAADVLAREFDHRDAERRLSSARHRALHTLRQPDAAPSSIAWAESILRLSEGRENLLLVAEFADSEQALAVSSRLMLEPSLNGVTAVETGRSLTVLLPDGPTLGRVSVRLEGASGVLGAGYAGPVNATNFAQMQRDATTASQISYARGGRLLSFDEVSAIIRVTSSIPEDQARMLIADVLGPIEDYDQQHDARLLETLVTYLSLNGSTTGTARRMHLHVNTVKQRLERINGLLNADVRDYSFIARLTLALEWRSLLRD